MPAGTAAVWGNWSTQNNGKVNFFKLYYQDTTWLALCLLAFPVIWFTASTYLQGFQYRQLDRFTRLGRQRILVSILLVTLIVTVLGANGVYHLFTLSVDETLLRFQAVTFNEGYAIAPLQAEWQPFAKSLQPLYVKTIGGGQYWDANYRPVSAMITAFFGIFGLAAYTNAFLGVGCAWLLARIAKILWPEDRAAPLLAVIFLVTSAQFLFNAMSWYAMTSHLFLNLLWLCLFLQNRLRCHIAAALTGFFAIGLHQVFIHPFFVLPFLLDLLRRGQFRPLAVYGITYTFGLAFWLNWTAVAIWLQGIEVAGTAEIASAVRQQSSYFVRVVFALLFHERSIIAEVFFWASNVIRFVTWQNLAVLLLGMAALASWRDAPRPIRLLGLSVLTSLIPYLLLMPGQGHGWGYRHIHVHLGSFALIAVFGWQWLRARLAAAEWRRWRNALVGLTLFSTAVGLPLRAFQVDRFLTPFVDSLAYLSQREEQVVLVDRYRIWYGTDLIRNDPLLRNAPKILDPYSLSSDELRTLCAKTSVRYVGAEELAPFGMRKNNPDYLQTALEENGDVLGKLAEAGCPTATE